jgi:hypothetical protein
MAQFLPSYHNFNKDYACRGTRLIGAGKLSRYCYYVNSTGAVSRYKFDRSQKSVTMQDYNCGHWSGVGLHFYKGHDIESRIAKTVTSL